MVRIGFTVKVKIFTRECTQGYDGQTLTFNGTTANYESNTKSYTV
jgi:hypothetical protein